jgi:hypothetical protein
MAADAAKNNAQTRTIQSEERDRQLAERATPMFKAL